MKPLRRERIDNIIGDTLRVCETVNAYKTYKQNGWKANFLKVKRVEIAN